MMGAQYLLDAKLARSVIPILGYFRDRERVGDVQLAGPERELYQEFRRIAGQPIENVISRLRPKIDLFFDQVLVNAEDAAVRENRMALVSKINRLYTVGIADLSALSRIDEE